MSESPIYYIIVIIIVIYICIYLYILIIVIHISDDKIEGRSHILHNSKNNSKQ